MRRGFNNTGVVRGLTDTYETSCVNTHGRCMYVWALKNACASPPLSVWSVYIWERGWASSSHICRNQNKVFQIQICFTAPIGLFPSPCLALSLCKGLVLSLTTPPPPIHCSSVLPYLDTFFSQGLVVSSQDYMWEISPWLYFSHEV